MAKERPTRDEGMAACSNTIPPTERSATVGGTALREREKRTLRDRESIAGSGRRVAEREEENEDEPAPSRWSEQIAFSTTSFKARLQTGSLVVSLERARLPPARSHGEKTRKKHFEVEAKTACRPRLLRPKALSSGRIAETSSRQGKSATRGSHRVDEASKSSEKRQPRPIRTKSKEYAERVDTIARVA